ncbi:regulator of telomere elongation helicase 1 [Angomonas deanei]|uniref:DEAD_2/Helicase C-terminal domain containing protein, putative n=1 Tax=Angomonas deanei TaxID=59799 RepID=A0A7G2CAA5_9TRYP|nr:regulator of telomere elongation helicase 1 [Angomonas deanei]CAD2216489.1 DEAD_2/Helicase C-terminal domain containing protein, putative [Angomonas deanei]|eukprot:EPY23118.1 regulator of telomere elongation helicase 1 [Angomonas deanei]
MDAKKEKVHRSKRPREQSGDASGPLPPATYPFSDFRVPFEPYSVQCDMVDHIREGLRSVNPQQPIIGLEVPTGCGKTIALLAGVLEFQRLIKTEMGTPKEKKDYFESRRFKWEQFLQQYYGSVPGPLSDDTLPKSFFKQFRTNPSKKLNIERHLEELNWTATSNMPFQNDLAKRFSTPVCSVFYVTKTHAQLQQVVREYRRLLACAGENHTYYKNVKMNILGSRDKYCVHPTIVRAKGAVRNGLPVENNNLGEMCDKLVTLDQCPCVDNYGELATRALQGGMSSCKGHGNMSFDMEDIVQEGAFTSTCPYYATREMSFYAEINFLTYNYVLDPLIRHETKMERIIRNNSVFIFDEAHNVSGVCQDSLSVDECPGVVLELLLREIEPLFAEHSSAVTLAYHRDFAVGDYSLASLFQFLFLLFDKLREFTVAASFPTGVAHQKGDLPSDKVASTGEQLVSFIRPVLQAFAAAQVAAVEAGKRRKDRDPEKEWYHLFRQAYAIVFSLGVTFNPFQFSIFALAHLKRYLLVLKFLFLKPQSFSTCVEKCAPNENHLTEVEQLLAHLPPTTRETASLSATTHLRSRRISIRCLDPALAFHYFASSTYRVILASGTLSPFSQLVTDLGLYRCDRFLREVSAGTTCPNLLIDLFAGHHVVPTENLAIHVVHNLLSGEGTVPLRCNYVALGSADFVQLLTRNLLRMIGRLCAGAGFFGGVLCFVPNYGVLESMFAEATRQLRGSRGVVATREPRGRGDLREVLDFLRTKTGAEEQKTVLLFCVFRGKAAEGIDFTDSMARLIVVVGIPYAPLLNWKVRAQRAFKGEVSN